MDSRVKQSDLDPVTLEVIRNALPAISNEMSADLQRTSYNMMIYEVRDYCTALVNPAGELVSQNVGGVSHFIADLGVLIEDAVKRYGREGFKPGDVLITNHQAVAGQHLNNVAIHLPFFFEGELLMFAICRAHWIDVGGTSTGFGSGPVADPWLEGLQFDQLKIYEDGKLNEMLYRMIKDNIRFPESSLGDLKSQIAACRLALRRLDELFRKYGRNTVVAAIARIFDETEQRCRNIVAGFKDGTYEARSSIDTDGITANQPYNFHVKVVIADGNMTIDLSDCPKERQVGWNARTRAAPRIAYKALTLPQDPVNEGSFRALNDIIPEGNMMMARYPICMSGWSTYIPTVVDTIVAAVAPAMPERCPAAHHGNLGGAVFFGINPNTKRRYMLQTIEGAGWGGRPHEDGESALVSVCQGDVRNASIEATELKCPLIIEERALRRDSGGPGKHRGGLGTDFRVRNLMEGRWAARQPQRKACPSWGLWDGEPGEVGTYLLKLPGEKEFKQLDALVRTVPPQSVGVVRHGGGGGWGDPLERNPEEVRWDVVEELVSKEAARERYGVVLQGDGSVDAAATRAQRETLRSRPKSTPMHSVNARGTALAAVAGMALAAAMAGTPLPANAQQPSSRTLQLVVPFAPGAANDNLARVLSAEVSETFGRVVIENRPGGDGSIAGQYFKRAPADGNSIMLISNSYAINAAMRDSLPYNVLRDFAPVIHATTVPFFLVVNQEALPVNSPGELVKYARANPGKLSFASAGNGSPHHLAMEMFKLRAGIDMVHVPYKGLGLGMGDFLTGRVQLVITGFPAVANAMKTGKLRVLAVAGTARSSLNPDAPTFKESGVDGVAIDVWQGVLVPAGTPAHMIERLNAEFNRILRLPRVREKLVPQGIDAVGGTPVEFGMRLRSDIEMYRGLVKAVNLRVE